MKKFLRNILPPQQWRPAVIILLACFLGLGVYTLYIGKAFSYLSDNPKTCINCHVMYPEYITWMHSSHGRDVSCNDCHVPHNNALNKYFFKAKDGMRHASMFALRLEPQVISIKEAGMEVVQENCERCHASLIAVMERREESAGFSEEEERRCWDCHREVPHGRVKGLSSIKTTMIQEEKSPVPQWLNDMVNNKK
jgi:cytochrome c nitrite reductase small subunit